MAKSHPSGPAYPVTRKWQDDVQRQLDDNKAAGRQPSNRAELARLIGCKPPSLTALLKPGAKQSSLVPRIHKAFGWAKPGLPRGGDADPAKAKLEEMLSVLSPAEADSLIEMAPALVKLSPEERAQIAGTIALFARRK